MITLDEENIFWDMYQVARDMDGFKAKSHLEECKNRFLERLIEDPHILKSEMDEFFSDKKKNEASREKVLQGDPRFV